MLDIQSVGSGNVSLDGPVERLGRQKKGGKYVAPGVYFYVIEATGSDGKPIKRKGSINILRSKQIQDEIIEE